MSVSTNHSKKPYSPYPETLREPAIGEVSLEVFTPKHHQVVMGASGKPDQEVYLDALQARQIPLYKRKGGGGTVLLGPETIVVTLHAGVMHRFKNLAYFKAVNLALIAVFQRWRALDYHLKGISDIAVANRKIVGTSIFRRKHYLLYQASIIVDLDLELVNQVLRHPPKEPDYRQGRPHAAFITSLRQLGIQQNISLMVDDLRRLLPGLAAARLALADKQPAT